MEYANASAERTDIASAMTERNFERRLWFRHSCFCVIICLNSFLLCSHFAIKWYRYVYLDVCNRHWCYVLQIQRYRSCTRITMFVDVDCMHWNCKRTRKDKKKQTAVATTEKRNDRKDDEKKNPQSREKNVPNEIKKNTSYKKRMNPLHHTASHFILPSKIQAFENMKTHTLFTLNLSIWKFSPYPLIVFPCQTSPRRDAFPYTLPPHAALFAHSISMEQEFCFTLFLPLVLTVNQVSNYMCHSAYTSHTHTQADAMHAHCVKRISIDIDYIEYNDQIIRIFLVQIAFSVHKKLLLSSE